MMKSKKKISKKKKRCHDLTFQTCDLGHQTVSTIDEEKIEA